VTTPKASAKSTDLDQIVIRSWPKVTFLYPVMFVSFFCGAIQHFTTDGINSEAAYTMGLVFFCILCLNLLVLSFEFSRFKTLAIFAFFLAFFFFLLYLSTRWEVFRFLREIFDNFKIRASTSFYFAIGTYLLLTLGGVFLTTRFNYWIIRSNEILHKEGFLGDVKRFPSPNLKMTKEITDVFEFLLLGSGKIVLYPTSEKQAFVLEHVPWVNDKERKIQVLLSTISVEVEEGSGGDEEESVPGA